MIILVPVGDLELDLLLPTLLLRGLGATGGGGLRLDRPEVERDGDLDCTKVDGDPRLLEKLSDPLDEYGAPAVVIENISGGSEWPRGERRSVALLLLLEGENGGDFSSTSPLSLKVSKLASLSMSKVSSIDPVLCSCPLLLWLWGPPDPAPPPRPRGLRWTG